MKKIKNDGITLIALIITIIVLLILAGVSLSAVVGENGVLTNAMDAKLKTKFAKYNEALGLNAVDDTGVYAVKDKMKAYIPDMEDSDLDKFVIVKSKLLYVGTDEKEMEVAEKLGIGSGGEGSDSKATVEEIQEIVDGVVELKDKFADGQDSTNDNTETGFIGTKLLDRKTHLYDGTWNILIDYNKDNKEVGRYEKGYWLEKGKTYTINDKSIEFKNDYVIDYENKDFTVLSENKVNWNEKATLGVSKYDEDENDILPLNLDPMTLANGEWKDSGVQDEVSGKNFFDFYNNGENTGIQKTGDVTYDNINKALNFNEVEEKPNGYLKLTKKGVDFKNGFTFEFYGNLNKIRTPGPILEDTDCFGLFCKIPNLTTAAMEKAMRFGYTDSETICKFNGVSSYVGEGKNLHTIIGGAVDSDNGCGYKEKEDFYLTFVYRDYIDGEENEYYDDEMKSKKVDKIEYYVNGNLFGYTYYGSDSYDQGCEGWNTDEAPFFIGVCPWGEIGNNYFVNGKCYLTRLYTISLSPKDVKLNYDTTLKYRDSFKNE